MSTWHIFCVCQVANVVVSERLVNFLERRLGEVHNRFFRVAEYK